MNTSLTGQRSTQRGMALAVALLALLILTVLGLALGSMGIENLNQIRAAGDTAALVHAANGGLHELMNRIYGNGSSTNGAYGRGVTDNSVDVTGTYTTSLASCHYWWTFNTGSGEPYCTNNLEGTGAVTGWNGMRVPARTALLVTSADVVPRAESERPVRIVALVNNGLPYAISSDGTIDANNVTSLIPGQANIRSNNTTGTSSNPNVEVASVDGTVFSRNGSGTIKVTGASGPQLFDQDPITIPNIPITTVVQSQSTAGVGGAHPYGGPAAIQIAKSGPAHSVSNNADGTELLIDGIVLGPRPVSVYVDGDVRFSGGGSLSLPQGVHLFVRGDVEVSGSLDQQSTPAPTGTSTSGLPADKNFLFCTGDLTFNGAQGQSLNLLVGETMLQHGTSNFSGLLYSQNGDVDFRGGGTLTGAIIAREGVSTHGGNTEVKNLNVIFNPAVLNTVSWLGFGILGPVHTTSWWVVTP